MNYSPKRVEKKIEEISTQKLRNRNRHLMTLVSFAIGFFVLLFVAFLAFTIGSFVEIIHNAPSLSNLESINPTDTKSIIYASDGSVMQELVQSGSNRETVTYEQMPKDLVNAFVAIEDTRFFSHDGVDVKGILRAVFVGVTSGSLSEGASTITQQLIKNNIFNGGLEKNFGDRIERKLQEQAIALRIEREIDKKRIMQYYLNTINLGSNCLGVQVASKRYFGKNVWELDLSECSVLAPIAQNPTRFNPITHPENNQKRRLIVLKYMLNDGKISEDQYNEAVSEDVYRRIQAVSSSYTGPHVFSYFTDKVFEEVLLALQEELGYTDTQAYNLLYSGGLRIYTTMDPTVQAIVDEEVNNPENYIVETGYQKIDNFLEYALSCQITIRLSTGEEYHYDENNLRSYHQNVLGEQNFQPYFQSLDSLNAAADQYVEYLLKTTGGELISRNVQSVIEPQTSVIIIDQHTGQVKAVTGGRGNKEELGSLVLNRATESLRQPGSTFKPLVTYAPAIDICGDTLASTYYDSPLVIGGKTIRNWWGEQGLGYANIRFGIMASMNVLAVRCMENTVTENTAYAYAKDFGITSLVPQDKSYSLTLGGLTYGVTNEELTSAYAAIANDGVYQKPIYWTHVTDESGNLLLQNETASHRIIKSSTALLLTSAMESSISPEFMLFPQYGVGATSTNCSVDGMGVAGKSGTTNDANDLWFVGYSPYYTCGIWSGYDSSKSFGSSPGYHRIIWQHIMARIHESLESASFDYSSLVKARICSKSGLLARDGICDACGDPNCHVYEEYFAPGTEPTEYCDRHVAYDFCSVSGMPAGEFCPEDAHVQRIFLMIDSEDNDGSTTADTYYTISSDKILSTCTAHHAPEPETETESESDEDSTDESGSDESGSASSGESSSQESSPESETAPPEESSPAEEASSPSETLPPAP